MGECMPGKAVADNIRQELAAEIAKLSAINKIPRLALVRVGQRAEDMAYEKGVIATAEKIGMEVITEQLPAEVTANQLVDLIQRLNNDAAVHGIMLFRPLPKHINEKAIKDILSPAKDIDCLTHVNEGKVFEGDISGFPPCTPAAVLEMLDYYGVDVAGKEVTIVGSSNVVGKPMALMLMNRKATVTVCNTKTSNLAEKTRRADIVIVAAGKARLIDGSFLKDDSVVIDVGINELEGKLCGDVDYDSAIERVRLLTPVPRGVGSVTTSILAKHVVKACKMQCGLINPL